MYFHELNNNAKIIIAWCGSIGGGGGGGGGEGKNDFTLVGGKGRGLENKKKEKGEKGGDWGGMGYRGGGGIGSGKVEGIHAFTCVERKWSRIVKHTYMHVICW